MATPQWYRAEVSVPVWAEPTPALRDEIEERIKTALRAEFDTSLITIHEVEEEEDE